MQKNFSYRTLEPLLFKQLCTRIPAASTEDDEETKARILEEQDVRARKLEQRSSVVIGLNQVTRALEKGALKLVLVREILEIDCFQVTAGFHRKSTN